MNFKELSNMELRELLLHHDKKAHEEPENITKEDLDEAWGAAYESLQRNQARSDRQEQELAQIRNDVDDLIVTDITYRAAYKFIYEKGMDEEFREFLEASIVEGMTNVIPFPKSH